MVKEAESHSADDQVRREKVELDNQAEGLIYTTEKNLTEHGEKIEESDKTQVEADVAALREVMEGDDRELIKSKLDALTQSSMKLGEAMYKAEQDSAAAAGSSADGGGPGETAGGAPGDDAKVVDADFEEVEDDKKDKSA